MDKNWSSFFPVQRQIPAMNFSSDAKCSYDLFRVNAITNVAYPTLF
ncbi:MAG: hypothetical protein IPH68_15615 [Chitinophagaceae bacterium]|nr:hypothetical protein [Chitinophagaceae bacterium]